MYVVLTLASILPVLVVLQVLRIHLYEGSTLREQGQQQADMPVDHECVRARTDTGDFAQFVDLEVIASRGAVLVGSFCGPVDLGGGRGVPLTFFYAAGGAVVSSSGSTAARAFAWRNRSRSRTSGQKWERIQWPQLIGCACCRWV